MACLVAGCAGSTVAGEPAPGGQETGRDPGWPLTGAEGDVQLSCGSSGPGFPASAMTGGVDGLADPVEVEEALDRLAAEAGIDAPTELLDTTAAEARWIVLGTGGSAEGQLLVGTGPWGADGPGRGGEYVSLERADDAWRATGWGDCNLEPVLPSGSSWVEVTSARRDASSATAVQVEVNERECVSGRDPGPFLQEPTVVEKTDTVVVYWTSESPTGDQNCVGNPSVRRVLELDRPLGDRALLDGSTWPARQVPFS